jgi:acetylornithine deacetylase/succinyl-diaminopimelate desuccinylase-like protein
MISIRNTIRDTRALVSIDSQNPGALEGRCTEWVGNRLSEFGFSPQLQSVAGARSNILAGVSGAGSAPRLVLLAHMDTVPIGEGWTLPPLGGIVADERIYGRGACDMKAGLAVALNLLGWLFEDRICPSGDVLLVATVDEESPDMLGAHALVASGLLRPDDQILALEPTAVRLRIAQMGLRWIRLTVFGRMAHAGRAHLGLDANHMISRVVDRLKQAVNALPYNDEILGRPRLTCGVLTGGVATNVVPPSAEAQLDLRVVPPMTPREGTDMVRTCVEEVLVEFPGARYEIGLLGPDRPAVRTADDAKIVVALRDAYSRCTGSDLPSGGGDGHEAYTDASMVAALTGSRTCAVLGPGATDNAHAADEFVRISDIELTCQLMSELIRRW